MTTDEDAKRWSAAFDAVRESNILVRLLAGAERRKLLSPKSRIKYLVLGNQGEFLHKLARMSRVRFLATLAYVEIGADDVPNDELLAHLDALNDFQLLDRVVRSAFPDAEVHPRLPALLRKIDLVLRARVVARINYLLTQGANAQALRVAVNDGRLDRRLIGEGGGAMKVMPVTAAVSHLMSRDSQVLAFDALARMLHSRTNGLLPNSERLRGLFDLDALREEIDRQCGKYQGELQVPDFAHPRLRIVNSVPELRAFGRASSMANCWALKHTQHHRNLVLGTFSYAVYSGEPRLALQFTVNGDNQFELVQALGKGNLIPSAAVLAEAIADLGSSWRMAPRYAASLLGLEGAWLIDA